MCGDRVGDEEAGGALGRQKLSSRAGAERDR